MQREAGRQTGRQRGRERCRAPDFCWLIGRQSGRAACDWMAAGVFFLPAVHVWMGLHLPQQPFDTMGFSEGENERA